MAQGKSRDPRKAQSHVSQAALHGGHAANQGHGPHLMQARHGVLIPRPQDAMEFAAHLRGEVPARAHLRFGRQ